jgi:DNA-binding winged helix-turn-helix (wHTH) protein/tetratricopeptide (TPR) repeat protein
VSNNDNRIYRFGDFVVDVPGRELRRDGEDVVVQPRVYDLLVYLIEHQDRAVDKDELQDAVWPGMFVTETALTRAVMKARKAVGDDAHTQSVIKTLHGHGYRFVAELAPGENDETEATAAEPLTVPTPPEPASRRRLPPILLTVAAVVLAAVLAWAFLRPPPTLGSETRIAVLPLLNSTGNAELAWTSLGLMSYASNLIDSDGQIAVVSEGSVVSLADNFGWSGALDDPENEKLIDKLRRVYGASHLLAMQLQAQGGALRMNYSLLSPDGRQQRGTMVGDEGTELAQGVVQGVYGSMLRKSHVGEEMQLVSEDPFNNEAFARGMSLSLEGRCAEAAQYFRVIIDQEPTLFSPRFEYAACLRILGEWQEAETLLNQLIEEQRALGPRRPLAASLMTLGILYNRTGRLDEAEETHKEALVIAEAIEDDLLAGKILNNLAIVAEDRGEWAVSEALADRAVLKYESSEIESLPGQLWSLKANLAMDQNQLAEADTFLIKALAAFREIGDRRNEAMMLNNSGYLRRRQGRLIEAEDYHLRSLEMREEIGDRVGVGRIHGMLAVIYTANGRYEESIASSQKALEIARESRDMLFQAVSLANIGDAEKAMGNYESARLNYLEGKAIFVNIQDEMRVLQSDLKVAGLDLLESRLDSAESITLGVLQSARDGDFPQPEIQALELLGDIAIARGDTAAGIEELGAALAQVRDSTWAEKENTLLYKLANAYMDIDDQDSAAPLIGALKQQDPNVQSLKAQARFAFNSGDGEVAVSLMSEAKSLAGGHWAEESEAALLEYQGY